MTQVPAEVIRQADGAVPMNVHNHRAIISRATPAIWNAAIEACKAHILAETYNGRNSSVYAGALNDLKVPEND